MAAGGWRRGEATSGTSGQPGSRRHAVRMATSLDVAGIAPLTRSGGDAPSPSVTHMTVFLTMRVSGG